MTLTELNETRTLLLRLKALRDGAEPVHFELAQRKREIEKADENLFRAGVLSRDYLKEIFHDCGNNMEFVLDKINEAIARLDRLHRYGVRCSQEGGLQNPSADVSRGE